MLARSLLVVVLYFCLATAHASGALRATLIPPPPDSNTVTLELTNSGDDDISIVSYTVPTLSKNGRLWNSALMRPFDSKGQRANYTGIYMDLDVSGPDTFITLPPGSTKRFEVDLGLSYDLVPGETYTVQVLLQPKYLDRALGKYPKRDNATLRPLYRQAQIYPIKLTASPSALATARQRLTRASATPPGYQACSADQVAQFETVKAQAKGFIEQAFGEMWSMPIWVHPWHWESTPNYIRWFGEHYPWPYMPDGHDLHEDDEFWMWAVTAVWGRANSSNTIDGSTLPPISVTCECDGDHNENTASNAWIERNVYYQINTCPKYWQLPIAHDPAVPDASSQVGTLIHELPHFNDVMNSGTDDITYSYQDTLQLASQHAQAVHNAQSYKFWMLQQP